MLNPHVQVHDEHGLLVAEFWDCLRLDMAPVQDLVRICEAAWARPRRADLVLDFLGVDFAGSTALSGLVRLQKLCRQKGGRLVLCNTCPTVYEAFRLSRLAPLFTFAADRPAAVALLGAGREATGLTTGTTDVPPPDQPPEPIDPAASPRDAGPEP